MRSASTQKALHGGSHSRSLAAARLLSRVLKHYTAHFDKDENGVASKWTPNLAPPPSTFPRTNHHAWSDRKYNSRNSTRSSMT
eukprot:6372358-Pyramimonas_sp.AAC.1